ncbi:uncharacterized protein LOC117477766 [Trematomus bernacchii]|uniref:uncharacterized protein LOC117477766 n=1 Tax=Trematomus bernacchii TaxID=40690 RepID=UPI00146C53EE|nr:uncharacterized protein LOC117477766 [Trematomus bernacchii]
MEMSKDDWAVPEVYSVDEALDFLDPSGGHESDDYAPSIHGSPGGSPILSLLRTEETERGPGVSPVDGPVVSLSAVTALPSIGGILQELPEIISKAAAWRDLRVPPAQESTFSDDMSGVFSQAQRVRSDPIWPRFPPIRKYQEGAAANPRTLRAPVSTYAPLARVEGFTDKGFPTVPPLEPSLTTFFGVKQASTVAGRRPMLTASRDQFVARQTDRMHQCAYQASAAANNIALLVNSMVRIAEQSDTMSSGEAEEIGKAASTALTLSAAVAVSQARITTWATQVHRYLWLQQGSIPEGAGKELIEAPISPDGLFGPQFHTMVESRKSASEQADDIRCHVGWLQPDRRPQQQQRQQRPQHLQQSQQGQRGQRRDQQRRQNRPSAAAGAPSHVSAPPPQRQSLQATSRKGTKNPRSWSAPPAPREPPRKQSRKQLGLPFEQAASDLSVSRRQGSLHKPAVYNQAVIRQRGLTCKPVASGLSVSRQHGFSSVPGRGEMQCVETPSQPFRAGPPLGCFTSNSGKGSGMARHHDYHSTTRTGLPALGALLRVAADMFDGQMDEQADQQREELQELLVKSAISRVPQGEENRRFYSRYFLIPKKTGGMRPILDLSAFNRVIMKRPFHMLTIKQVLEYVHQGDWFMSIDLKDAYFHITIIPKHRKFLRFSFQGISYQFNRLPFGYSLAPRTFSKCVETALEPLHRGGMRVLFYLDDLLLLARSKKEAALQTVQLVSHLSSLGFIVNWKKSCPLPSQVIIYLGVELNSALMRARLSQQRVEKVTALLRRVTPRRVVTALSVMQLLGMMSAGHVVIPLGLLHMRRLQRWFIRLHIDPVRQKRRMVYIPPSVGLDLAYWKNLHVLSVGVPLGRVTSHTAVFTDASLAGWGGTCMSQAVGGQWPAHMSLHINVLELISVWRVIQHFAPLLFNQHVLIRTDNRAAAAYINRQGGVRSAQLLSTARRLLCWAQTHVLSIRAVYIPGVLNRGADLMSRGGPRQGDWSLHPELVSQVWSRFGRAEVDLFAARENAQCALWFSLRTQDHPPLGVDAFAHRPWPKVLLYAFPPVPLIPRFLDRVQEERLTAILIAPERTGASWFPCLQRMLSGRPWEIPWRRDALSQVEGAISGHPVLGQRLWAWPLNGNI